MAFPALLLSTVTELDELPGSNPIIEMVQEHSTKADRVDPAKETLAGPTCRDNGQSALLSATITSGSARSCGGSKSTKLTDSMGKLFGFSSVIMSDAVPPAAGPDVVFEYSDLLHAMKKR